MTSTPSVRTDDVTEQAPLAPDRMTLVADWRHAPIMVELYADRRAGDGYVIVFVDYGPERAADIADLLDELQVTWIGRHAQASWREDVETRVRAELEAWSS